MHQLRLSILFCTLLSQISLSQSASNEVLSDKLDIVFAGIKPRYYQGESVDITIRIMNPFDHPVALTGCDKNTGCIDLKVFDANNTQLEYKGSSSFGPETEEMQIAGNGEYVFQDNLEVLFFNDTSIPGASEFLPGTYKLVARINGTHSKELEFEILEQKAIDKTVKAKVYNLLYSVSSEDKIENAIVLLDEYPNSIYVSKIYKILLSNLIHLKRLEEVESWFLRYLDTYPNTVSISTQLALYKQSVIKKLGGINQVRISADKKKVYDDKMNYLLSKYSNNSTLKISISKALDSTRKCNAVD